MGTMRGGGMGMNMRAERSPHGRGVRAGQPDPPKKKPDLKKVWPQVRALVAPRIGLLMAGMALMVVNRVAGLVLPFLSKPLLDKVLRKKLGALTFLEEGRSVALEDRHPSAEQRRLV